MMRYQDKVGDSTAKVVNSEQITTGRPYTEEMKSW